MFILTLNDIIGLAVLGLGIIGFIICGLYGAASNIKYKIKTKLTKKK